MASAARDSPAAAAAAARALKPRTSSGGRKKIPMEKIKKKEALQVSFSKRRKGLFKKIGELSVLCGAQVASIVFSPGNKPFSFGSPSVDHVIQRFLQEEEPAIVLEPVNSCVTAEDDVAVLHQQVEQAQQQQQPQQRYWWDHVNIDVLGFEELCVLQNLLEEVTGY